MQPDWFLYFDATGDKVRYTTSTERTTPSVQNHIDIVNMNSAQGRIRLLIGNTGSDEQFLVDNTIISCKRNLRAGAGLESNNINSIGNSNLNIQRGGSTAITLKAGNEVDFSGYVNINNISTPNDTDMAIRRNDIEFIRLFKDETTSAEAIICYKILRVNDEIKTNTINSIDNNNLVLQRNGTPYLTLNGTNSRVETGSDSIGLDAFTVYLQHLRPKDYTLGDTVFYGNNSADDNFIEYMRFDHDLEAVEFDKPVKTDTIDAKTNTDLVINRNGDEFIKLQRETSPVVDFIRMAHSVIIDNNRYLDTNNIRHESGVQLNLWSTSSIRLLANANPSIEVKSTQIDFNANVVSSYSITTFDLIETSDKKLKDNIEDVDEDCSEIVKKVNVKTFNYKSDDKKKNHIGFIAQDVKEVLPKKFEAVVNNDGEHMGINYGKMSTILWKALQEETAKTEYLESKLFDTIARVEALEKPKPKAKAKSKTKVEK